MFKKPTPKGTFLNRVEDGLESKDGVDESEVRSELNEWLNDFAELSADQEKEMMTEEMRQVVEAAHTPIEIYDDGENVTWHVTATYGGRTRVMKFSTGEMFGNSPQPLQMKWGENFYQRIEIESEDWEEIRDRWTADENTSVELEQNETPDDAVADRVLGFISRALIPVEEQDRLGNEISMGWFDADNNADYPDADPGESILWLQDSFVINQLNSTSKSTEYKGQLVKNLISRGDLHGTTVRRYWTGGNGEEKFWPFDPAALNVSESDVRFTGGAADEIDV